VLGFQSPRGQPHVQIGSRLCENRLSDDGKSATAYAFWNDDAKTICASFELARPMTEEAFDANGWAARLMEGDAT